MTEIIKNLSMGRNAVDANDFAEAKKHYEIVHKAMPEDLEAEWFYLFSSVVEGVNNETSIKYNRLLEIFYPTLQYIATFEESEEKQTLVIAMIKAFPPLYDVLHNAMIQNLASNCPTLTMDDVVKMNMTKIDKKALADDIIYMFGEGEPYCLLAADIWKEMIAERFKWSEYRNFQDKGKELWFDELGKRIKKYDSSYQMPQFKQAGCITSGDAAKVTPGK